MTTAEIILKLRQKSLFLLLATLLTFGLVYFMYLRVFASFKSESSFYVNENVVLSMSMGQADPQQLNILTTMAANKVLLLISSDELRDSIIKDFDLYKHYHVDVNSAFAREKVLLRLNRNIAVRREANSNSLVHLTVEDGDRYVAAGMANKIVERVNLMNKAIMRSDLQRRVAQYEHDLPSLKDRAADTRKQFEYFVDSVTPSMSKHPPERDGLPTRYSVIASDLVGKMDKTSSKYDEMLEEYYAIMSKVRTVGNDEWQCVTIVKKALPDITSWNQKIMLYSLGTSLFALFFYISALVYYYQNEEEMKLVTLALKGKKAQEPVVKEAL